MVVSFAEDDDEAGGESGTGAVVIQAGLVVPVVQNVVDPSGFDVVDVLGADGPVTRPGCVPSQLEPVADQTPMTSCWPAALLPPVALLGM